MTLHEFAAYLDTWNDWIVMPSITLTSLVVHFRQRKPSTFMLFIGLLLMVLSKLPVFPFAHSPLHPLFFAGPAIGALGLILAIVGFIWLKRKDSVPKSDKT